MKGYIYKIENIENGMVYVGKTRNEFEKRVKSHFNQAFKEKNFSLFYEDIRKYGVKGFKASIIETIYRENQQTFETEMNQREQYYIDYYDSINNGYNTFYNHGKQNKTGNKCIFNNRENTTKRKGICVYDKNGNLIKKYSKLAHASIDLNMHKSSISNVLARRNKHCKGLIFRWSDEILDMNEYKDYEFVIRPERINYKGLFV